MLVCTSGTAFRGRCGAMLTEFKVIWLIRRAALLSGGRDGGTPRGLVYTLSTASQDNIIVALTRSVKPGKASGGSLPASPYIVMSSESSQINCRAWWIAHCKILSILLVESVGPLAANDYGVPLGCQSSHVLSGIRTYSMQTC